MFPETLPALHDLDGKSLKVREVKKRRDTPHFHNPLSNDDSSEDTVHAAHLNILYLHG